MSTESATTEKLAFTPLHRTTEVENIHAQVQETDRNLSGSTTTTNRKILVKHQTVIGDGSDIDMNKVRQ